MCNELRRSDKSFAGVFKDMTMTHMDRINSVNRGVAEYKPCHVDAFFDSGRGICNALISGGDSGIRTSAMAAQAVCAADHGIPVIVLHEGNRFLEQRLRRNFEGTGKYREISTSSPCFEPFYGLSELEISGQILETASEEYDMKLNARSYVDGISDFLKASGKNLSFKLYSTCPHSLIFDKVDDLEKKGKISGNEAREMKSKLMTGQSENYKLDTFFADFRMEIESLMYVSQKGYRPLNVITALKSGTVLCFDLVSVMNRLLFSTIMYQLKLARTRGMQYQIIIDSIPVNSSESYASYIKVPSDKVYKTIASEDFYAMAGSDEKVFSSVVGNTQILVVMNHSSGYTATKWAEIFGHYDKFEETRATSYGRSRKTPFSVLSSPNYNRTINISKNREYRVKPEAIMRMGNGEAYVLSDTLGELAHLVLTG